MGTCRCGVRPIDQDETLGRRIVKRYLACQTREQKPERISPRKCAVKHSSSPLSPSPAARFAVAMLALEFCGIVSERDRQVTKENSIVEIHVRLLGEGTNCSRPTQGVIVGHRLFRLLPTTDYNPDDEHWEFLPGSIVRAKEVRNDDGVYLLAVEGPFKFWKVLDKRRLLLALIEDLARDARISFEGDLHGLALFHIPDASDESTPTLRRNTRWPKQDFVIVPLEPPMGKKIMAAIGGTLPNAIIHIQIEKNGSLQFGAYDNFHPECIYWGSTVKQAVIESLISQGIIRPYTERRPKT